MTFPPRSHSAAVTTASAVAGGAIALLLGRHLPLGSPGFFAVALALTAAWGGLILTFRRHAPTGSVLLAVLAVAVLLRIPLALAYVDRSSDMVRYLWDGRVQTLGYNPYAVVPADPLLAHTHTEESATMPSLRARTPYAPAAQLFFRLVVSIHDSTRAMKLAIVACDLLTVVVLLRWLALTGRPLWLATVYAWHPLVLLEVAHSGHIDALGALWVVAAMYWLTARRTLLACVALVLAIATKPLPIVLVPLFAGRVRARDMAAGATLLALLYLPFAGGQSSPLGAVPNVVAHIRFNGPLFVLLASVMSPQAAIGTVILLGIAVAAWARTRYPVDEPAAWAWPMAIALLGAPVIYPWYLLFFTPFLITLSPATLPLTVWSLSALGAYTVWHISRLGGRWVAPGWVQTLEYGLPLMVALAVLRPRRRGTSPLGRS